MISLRKIYELYIRDYVQGDYTQKFAKQQRERLKVLNQSIEQTKQDLKQYKTWTKIVREEAFTKANPSNKFRIKHIFRALDECGAPHPDLLFIYGKKSIGKTVEQSRLINEIVYKAREAEKSGNAERIEKESRKVILIRNTLNEINNALKRQLLDPSWEVEVVGSNLIDKDKKKKVRGYVAYATGTGFQSLQGALYKDVDLIIWDECNDTGGSEALNENDIKKFIIAISSIVRDRKNVKIFMFGNLLRVDDKKARTNIFMKSLGITVDTNWKNIEVATPDGGDKTRILYVNTGEHYQGAENQKFVGILNSQLATDLATNNPLPLSNKVTDMAFFLMGKPLLGWAFRYKEGEYLMLQMSAQSIESPETQKVSRYYTVNIEPLNCENILPGYKLRTFNAGLANMDKRILYIPEEDFISDICQPLEDMTISGRVFFSDEYSERIFIWLMESMAASLKALRTKSGTI